MDVIYERFGFIMDNDIEHISEKARELANLIKKHRITILYEENLLKMRNDAESQRLLSRLVEIGKELNERAYKGEEIAIENSIENQMIQEELKNNEIVKSFIISQREYLELIEMIINLIRNPEEC